jgi:hypothetical protein
MTMPGFTAGASVETSPSGSYRSVARYSPSAPMIVPSQAAFPYQLCYQCRHLCWQKYPYDSKNLNKCLARCDDLFC